MKLLLTLGVLSSLCGATACSLRDDSLVPKVDAVDVRAHAKKTPAKLETEQREQHETGEIGSAGETSLAKAPARRATGDADRNAAERLVVLLLILRKLPGG